MEFCLLRHDERAARWFFLWRLGYNGYAAIVPAAGSGGKTDKHQ
jgi:hypothetical protein